ncbi:MAG TPA: hypothetical protein VKS78_06945 [Roseiarcus sp.]|nr:hypothetical protein [Roseiarcus sp.]
MALRLRVSLHMWERLKNWYRGEYVSHQNDPSSALVFIGGRYKQPLAARMLNVVFDFYLKNWRWCIGTMIAITGLVIHFTQTR